MKTMKWLLQREFWEHKGAFFWAPIAVGVAMVLFIGGGFLYTMAFGGMENVQIDGRTVVSIQCFPAELRYKIAHILASSYMGIAAPLFIVLPVVVFFYCLSALHDDRRDRSILFWKSLPLSDRDTVLSKVITALCVVPMITIAIAVAVSLLLLVLGMISAAGKGLNLFAPVLTEPNLYLSPLYLLAFLPLYILWAVGIPLVTIVLLKWFNFLLGQVSTTIIDLDWFVEQVVVRGLGGLLPGIWLGEADMSVFEDAERGIDPAMLLGQSYLTLATPGVWLGVAAGVAMLYAAVRLRRFRDEG